MIAYEFKSMRVWCGWLGYMWERALVALEVMEREKEEHETGDSQRLEEYIESTIKKWPPARKVTGHNMPGVLRIEK